MNTHEEFVDFGEYEAQYDEVNKIVDKAVVLKDLKGLKNEEYEIDISNQEHHAKVLNEIIRLNDRESRYYWPNKAYTMDSYRRNKQEKKMARMFESIQTCQEEASI